MLIHINPSAVLESASERRNQMAENELTLGARVRDLEKQTAENTGQLDYLGRAVRQGISLTIWQFVGFTLVMAGTFFGTLAWISTTLREENRQTREQLQRQIEQTRVELQRQIEQSERNMNARFEDLRLVVLSQQKQAPPKR
jgi:hypothetical protein